MVCNFYVTWYPSPPMYTLVYSVSEQTHRTNNLNFRKAYDNFDIDKVVNYDEKKVTMADYKEAIDHNFGKQLDHEEAVKVTQALVEKLAAQGAEVDEAKIQAIYQLSKANGVPEDKRLKYEAIHAMIDEVPKYGNDIEEVDKFAKEVAYTYTRPLEQYKNPRGGMFQAGLYPVSANVPLGAQTGATPDGRYAYTPIADGVGPVAGKDVQGPTATANSVSNLDHFIASNGTLFNQKFHPSALAGVQGLTKFVSLIRGFFDQKGMHMQFNVVSREILLDAQAHPENYKSLVVRVAGYSALFTTLSRSLQDDIIRRTEQGF